MRRAVLIALVIGITLLFIWLFTSSAPERSTPGFPGLGRLIVGIVVLIVALVGWLRRRREERPPRPGKYPGEPYADREVATRGDNVLKRDVIASLVVVANARSRELGLPQCTDIRTQSAT